MKFVRILALAISVSALMALMAANASATVIDGSEGMLSPGTASTAESEGTVVLHPPIGDIECKESSVSGTTTNTGSSTETVKGTISSLTFNKCNATVTVLANGTDEVHTKETSSNNNGTLTQSGTEVTVEFVGFHCIFKLNSTDIGTVTGSANTKGNETIDLEAMIPRTGGRSGAFCGSTAQFTGSYKVTSPSVANVT